MSFKYHAIVASQLGFRPSSAWLAEWERCSGGKLDESSSGGLAQTAWALAEMGHRPQASWLYSYVQAAYGRLDSFDAAQLAVVFGSLPAISPHPAWLDELVQICALAESSPVRRSGSFDEEVGQDGRVQQPNGQTVPSIQGGVGLWGNDALRVQYDVRLLGNTGEWIGGQTGGVLG